MRRRWRMQRGCFEEVPRLAAVNSGRESAGTTVGVRGNCLNEAKHCQHSLAPAGMLSSTMMRCSFSSPFSLWTALISMPQLS